MIKVFIVSLICLLFAGHAALAVVQPCNGQQDPKGAVQAEIEATVMPIDDDAADPSPSLQDHTSQCHDQCKGSGQMQVLSLAYASQAHETPTIVPLAQDTSNLLIRPPR